MGCYRGALGGRADRDPDGIACHTWFGCRGSGFLFILSAFRRWTSRKATIALYGAIAIAILTPMAISSYQQRFGNEPVIEGEEYDERAAFIRAASMILSDHPLGIGANNYVIVANGEGYQERAGVTWWGGSRATMVHNVYWLTAAELGYVGLVAYVFLQLRLIWTALNCGWRHRNDDRGDLLLGLGVAFVAVTIHTYFEWAILLYFSQYFWAIRAGLIAGLAQQLGYWRTTSRLGSPVEAQGFDSLGNASRAAGDIRTSSSRMMNRERRSREDGAVTRSGG